MTTVKLLRHQGIIMQAPYIYENIRYFFDVAGYASGKTSALCYCIARATKDLQGKKDLEGHNPRIILGSKNLTFMMKTSVSNLEQTFRQTGTEYRFDKKNNIIFVGTVEIYLIPLENPENIYGWSVACFEENTLITTDKGEKAIKDIKEGDLVLTTKGFKKVKHLWDNGVRDCIEVEVDGRKILCTPDHRFIDWGNNEIEAQKLKKEDKLVKLNATLTKEKGFLITDVGHLTAKTSSVVGQYKVYDLEVEDVHEYFANGVRVHNCAFLDELSELPPDICMEAIKSINDRVRQQIDGFRTPFIVSVSSAQGLDGQYMAMEHFKRNGMGYFKVRGETKDNVFLPKSYVENLYKIYNDKERKVYLEGHFMSVNSSLVFSDYDPAKNMLAVDLYDSLEPDDTVYIGQDFNNFGCAGVACTVKKGCIVVLKDYNIPDIRRAPEIFRYDFPTQKIVWVPDATSTAFYSQFKKELRAKDIRIAYRKSNPLVQDRVFVINKLLYAERMFITPISKEVEKSMLTHQFDPKTHIPMKGGEGAPDHISDALGYAVYYIVCWDRSLKDLYDVTLGRAHLSRLGSMGTEVEAGYNLLNPSRIALEAPENVNKDEWEKASKS